MKRMLTATCLAATFAVGLAAQSTTGTAGSTAQDPQTAGGGQRGGGPRTVIGCLRAGDTAGSYMLTDVQMQGGGRRGGDTTAAATTAGGTTTGGTTAAGSTAGQTAAGTTAQGGRAMAPQSIMLTADSSVDLKAHVGHKIEVTGTMAGGGRRGGDAGAGAATTTGGGGATTTGSGATTTGSGAAGTTTGAAGGQGMGRGGPRSMTVTSVRMISESCS